MIMSLKETKSIIKSFTTENKMYLKCSFLAAMRIVKSKKAYTVGEELLKLGMVDICTKLICKYY